MPLSAADIIGGAQAHSIDEVIEAMQALDAALPDADGVKWFNRLYLRVTFAVRADIEAGRVRRDPVWLERLDVIFANLYFSALAAGNSAPRLAPHAWRPLLESRHRGRIARIQFALAGMNAHINHDLAVAVVATYMEQGGEPSRDDARYVDYEHVNVLLERVEKEAKADFTTGPLGTIDRLLDQHDDLFAMWSVRAARDTAWMNAEILWGLRDIDFLRQRYLYNLGRLTGLAGRGLLAPRV